MGKVVKVKDDMPLLPSPNYLQYIFFKLILRTIEDIQHSVLTIICTS